VRVGLVGCGLWGANILRDLRLLGCDVGVVARSDSSVTRAREGGASYVVDDLEQLGEVGGLVVATPIATHAAVVGRALEIGVPVFVEKPLCDDSNAASRLAASASTRLFVMDKWRYHPGVMQLAAIAREGTLGHVHGLRTVRVQPDNRHDEDAVWVLVPHDLAICLEVLGELPQPRAAVGTWDSGRLETMHAVSDGARAWHVLEVSERAPRVERRIELHADDGVAILEGGWDEHITVYRGESSPQQVPTPGELPLLAELRAFVAHLSGGPAPRSSAGEGAAAVATIASLRALACQT
jgi:predicted dehydrogenase